MSNVKKASETTRARSRTGDRPIDVDQGNQVAYWTKRLGIPKWRLKELIKKVRNNPADVMEQLEREKAETALQHKLIDEETDRYIERLIAAEKDGAAK